jgi:hypothetical protein
MNPKKPVLFGILKPLFCMSLAIGITVWAGSNMMAWSQPPIQGEAILPILIRTDKSAYVGKDTITVTLENPSKVPVRVAPHLLLERGQGDGTFVSVYKLRVTAKCSKTPPKVMQCVTIGPKKKLQLAVWDWNTGGTDQCPPRRPGHRALKGVHRIVASACSKGGPGYRPRHKFVTFE